MRQQIGNAIGIVARSKPGFGIGGDGLVIGEIRRLFEIAHRRRRMAEDLAGLRLDQAGGDLQERRLARAVTADKADLVAGLDLQPGAGQQRRAAEAQEDVVEFQNGRGQDQTPVRS